MPRSDRSDASASRAAPESPSAATVDNEQLRLVDALAQVAFVVMATLNKIGAEQDLSLTQLRVLGILRDHRLKMTQLADLLGLDKSTMTGLVDRATKRGLLERAPNSDDGRAVDVFLSPGGIQLAERLQAQVVQSLSPRTGTLTGVDRHRLTALLENFLRPAQS